MACIFDTYLRDAHLLYFQVHGEVPLKRLPHDLRRDPFLASSEIFWFAVGRRNITGEIHSLRTGEHLMVVKSLARFE